jgi:hypothetical protein
MFFTSYFQEKRFRLRGARRGAIAGFCINIVKCRMTEIFPEEKDS